MIYFPMLISILILIKNSANNESLFRNNISTQFIKTIRDVNGLEIEMNDNILIVRLRKQFTPENGEIIAKFISGINNGRN